MHAVSRGLVLLGLLTLACAGDNCTAGDDDAPGRASLREGLLGPTNSEFTTHDLEVDCIGDCDLPSEFQPQVSGVPDGFPFQCEALKPKRHAADAAWTWHAPPKHVRYSHGLPSEREDIPYPEFLMAHAPGPLHCALPPEAMFGPAGPPARIIFEFTHGPEHPFPQGPAPFAPCPPPLAVYRGLQPRLGIDVDIETGATSVSCENEFDLASGEEADYPTACRASARKAVAARERKLRAIRAAYETYLQGCAAILNCGPASSACLAELRIPGPDGGFWQYVPAQDAVPPRPVPLHSAAASCESEACPTVCRPLFAAPCVIDCPVSCEACPADCGGACGSEALVNAFANLFGAAFKNSSTTCDAACPAAASTCNSKCASSCGTDECELAGSDASGVACCACCESEVCSSCKTCPKCGQTLKDGTVDAPNCVLSFTAPWCAPCQQMAPIVNRLRHAGEPIRNVDVDVDGAAYDQFHVTKIPSFIKLVAGREVGRIVGVTSESQIRQLVAMGEAPACNCPATLASAQKSAACCQAGACKGSECASGACQAASCQASACEASNCQASACQASGCPSGVCQAGACETAGCAKGTCSAGTCQAGCANGTCAAGACPASGTNGSACCQASATSELPGAEKVEHLIRATYNVSPERGQAMCELLSGFVSPTPVDCKCDAEGLTVTTTPEAQRAIAQFVKTLLKESVTY